MRMAISPRFAAITLVKGVFDIHRFEREETILEVVPKRNMVKLYLTTNRDTAVSPVYNPSKGTYKTACPDPRFSKLCRIGLELGYSLHTQLETQCYTFLNHLCGRERMAQSQTALDGVRHTEGNRKPGQRALLRITTDGIMENRLSESARGGGVIAWEKGREDRLPIVRVIHPKSLHSSYPIPSLPFSTKRTLPSDERSPLFPWTVLHSYHSNSNTRRFNF